MSSRTLFPIAIVGSRKFPNRSMVERKLNELRKRAIQRNLRLHIISGGAPGVDTWAHEWAIANEVMVTVIPAEWTLFRKKAGYLRNDEIWALAKSGIAFWDGESPGTQHSFQIAQKQGKKIQIIRSDNAVDDLPW